MYNPDETTPPSDEAKGSGPPAISLPRGGGAVRGIGEKFSANPVTGTGSLGVPIAVSPGRAGFGPQLSLTYDSGSGNGAFGLGWSVSLPSVTRKTDKGLPLYRDEEESDTFILSGGEDLVPVLTLSGGEWRRVPFTRTLGASEYSVQPYRPRVEGLFARVERWTNVETGAAHWRTVTRDNVTTLFGTDDDSRVYDREAADAGLPARVFTWLVSESHDDKGNAIVYEYKREDDEGVELARAGEKNRTAAGRSANRYVKLIKYGNRVSRLVEPDLSQAEWMFKVVFDYGEHAPDAPAPGDGGAWLCRNDPFSVYRAGFEVRTYRLCQRILTFHNFPGEEGVGADCLVRSTELAYQNVRDNPDDLRRGHPVVTLLGSVTQSGYRRAAGGYLKSSLPPLEFEYSRPDIQEGVREVGGESVENLPRGVDGSLYQWVDLDGEGLPGVLTEQARGWFYKRNLSPVNLHTEGGEERAMAALAPAQLVCTRPSLSDLASGRQQFLDLGGGGSLDLVQFDRPLAGYYERTEGGGWTRFAPFKSMPNVAWDDPNLRFVDLTGDGRADLFISEDDVFTWYPSLAEEGFGAPVRLPQAPDEEKGPRLLFSDGTQSVYLADMSGDGLTDLVRVRNGEVCYWPNLGYGRFAAKVTMDDSPLLDRPEVFDQRRVRLADVDGSGVADLLYLGRDGVQLYSNQSGNGWDAGRRLGPFPYADDLSSVTTADLLGNGTACLVWSSPLPGAARRPVRYIDLMGGRKPYLLVGFRNNLGMETALRYAPSTRFYLEDRLAGRPWVTKLPFPVQVVERVETFDSVSRSRFVSRYAYHHGHFDGVEREFRGFGMVEQWDTEELGVADGDGPTPDAANLDASSFVPPAYTKTWFHTGVYLGRERVANYFAGLAGAADAGEYYREPGWGDAEAEQFLLEDTSLPDGLTPEEEREACRALKGSMLRQEVYGLDGTDRAAHPYTVTEQNFTVERLQRRAANRHAVFLTHPRETLAYRYERRPEDPRVGHTLTLETDEYGNVSKSVTVGYGRRQSELPLQRDRDTQTRTLITYTETSTTDAVDGDAHPDDYRTPLPREGRTFELTGYVPTGPASRFRISDFVTPDAADPEGRRRIHLFDGELEYEETATAGRQRRLIEHARTVYRRDDLSGLLPPGQLEPLALPGLTYKLALTPGLLEGVFKRDVGAPPEESLLPAPAQVLGSKGGDGGGYVELDGDGRWWVPSGLLFYDAAADVDDPAATAAAELSEAREHFFSPKKFTDPFNQSHVVGYDQYDLAVVSTADAVQNTTTALYDYRVLQPRRVTDPNGNRSEARFDALGLVAGTAVMGKAAGPEEGDSFAAFAEDLTPQQTADYFDAADPRPLALAHLGTATTRFVYDLGRVPACAASIARETHDSALAEGEQTRVHLSFAYYDGVGRAAQTKAQAEPGPLDPGDPGAPTLDPRWVATGATVYNNKGKPVRLYEPFFSQTHGYGIEEHGVGSTLFYDPAERVVAKLHPDHAWEKTVFDPWRQTAYDVNDTVLNADGSTDPKSDGDVEGFFSRLPDSDYLPTWYEQRLALPAAHPERRAADKAAAHRQTPTTSHTDALGRAFLVVAHNRFERAGLSVEEMYPTRVELDVEGNQREVRDALVQDGDEAGRVVMRYDYDLLGRRIHQSGMDAGESWTLSDVSGKPVRSWNSRRLDQRTAYDELRRTTGVFVTENGVERLAERTVYGEGQGAAANHRTRVFRGFDGAGSVTSVAYDFKGNLLTSRRDLLTEYGAEPDWGLDPATGGGTFVVDKTYDALNRPASLVTPDDSVYRLTYNEANLIDRVEVNLRGEGAGQGPVWTQFVTDVDYDARGLRTLIRYANGAETTYEYDDRTFRLVRLKTTRTPSANGLASQLFADAATVQDLRYTYDPAGNMTRVEDAALRTVFHDGQQVEPVCEYTYDAVYRLVEARGREHAGQTAFAPGAAGGGFRDYPFAGPAASPNDLQALANYAERYEYDGVGNFERLVHQAGPGNSWTRNYTYVEPSLVEPSKRSNRLSATSVGQASEAYAYDEHGNMVGLPHLTLARWDFKNRLRATARQAVNGATPETTFYVYDAAGQRVRKVTERQNGTRKSEHVYLGDLELYREFGGGGAALTLERETLHVMDDKQRVALVETKTVEGGAPVAAPLPALRYQLGNHLGSASLELDGAGALISFEEYHPHGTTSFQATRGGAEVSLKRYRHTGKERDEETGFYYHGARYYAPWLARWTAADPIGLEGGLNLYAYVRGNPVKFNDPQGTDVGPKSVERQEREEQQWKEVKSPEFQAWQEQQIAKSEEAQKKRKPYNPKHAARAVSLMERARATPTVEVKLGGQTEILTLDNYLTLSGMGVLPSGLQTTLRTEHFTEAELAILEETEERLANEWTSKTVRFELDRAKIEAALEPYLAAMPMPQGPLQLSSLPGASAAAGGPPPPPPAPMSGGGPLPPPVQFFAPNATVLSPLALQGAMTGSPKTAAQFQGGPVVISGYTAAGGVPGGPNYTLQSWANSFQFGTGATPARPAFLDNYLRSQGVSLRVPGVYYASHAERQAWVASNYASQGSVSRELCFDCIGHFRAGAIARQQTVTLRAPNTTWTFQQNGAWAAPRLPTVGR